MKFPALALVSCAALLAAAADESWAGRSGSRGSSGRGVSHSGGHHGHRGHTRVFVGGAFFAGPAFYAPYPYYYPYPAPYYGYPPPPPVYIQQNDTPVTPESQLYWYYCQGSRAYYPYVQDCPGGWQRVMPHPMQPPTG